MTEQAPATKQATNRVNGMRAAVIVVAAGRGMRAGASDGPKQYRTVAGKAILAHTLDAFLAHSAIGEIVAVIHADDDRLFREAVGGRASRVRAVTGGATRQQSVRLGLLALKEAAPDIVLIHDAARPFVDAALIDRVLAGIAVDRGSLPALPVSDTLKRAGPDGIVVGTVPREDLHAAQAPQGFPYAPILAAHERAFEAGRLDFTDDAAIAEWAGLPVQLVAGSPDNIKLTWSRDIVMAEQRLGGLLSRYPDIRTGNGYDVHAFEPGDHVMLCGVRIAHDRMLSGHSDADVGLHALTDALLATCGAGDIGTHFPPSDPQWRGAASRLFVEHAARIVRERGGRIANADITLICEAPRIGPHRAAMTDALADMLRVTRDRISVKATTNEKLGFVGRQEGIAAIATASVIYPGEVPQ